MGYPTEGLSLGERLFKAGQRIEAVKGRYGVSPIMTTVQDDIMEAWRDRGSGIVTQLLGITHNKLNDWKDSRGLETPLRSHAEHLGARQYIRLRKDKEESHDGRACARCGGYVVDMGENLCVNCGHRPVLLEAG